MWLNLDAGERGDETEDLWSWFDLLNCACGGHAGDRTSMSRVAAFCAQAHAADAARPVRFGAHPSYPDRAHFGRRSIAIDVNVLAAEIGAQCQTLADVAAAEGVTVTAVKPHGALYHDAAASLSIAEAVMRGSIEGLGTGVMIIGPPAGALRIVAEHHGLAYAREGFADRRQRTDGSLVPRSEPDALITDPAEAVRQALSRVADVDTICIHADTPGAMAIARAVREAVGG